VIAVTRGGVGTDCGEHRADFLRLEVGGGRGAGLLRRHGQDAVILRGARGIVSEEVVKEPMERGQPPVAGRRPVAAPTFEVIEEGEDALDAEILEADRGH
jgi:hypothetical protein